MGFVHIRGDDGKLHLIHTSQIGLQPLTRKPVLTGSWSDVWAKMAKRVGKPEPT